MANISIKQLETFVHVADFSSFRRAADRLNTTQPNVSARVSTLEDQLGARLFERDAGSVRLTPKGETLLPHARRVLAGLDDLIIAADDDALFDGTMRLGVTEMIAHSWLGTYLSAVKERFPNVLVDLTVDLSTNLSESLFNRSIDLALQTGPFSRTTTGDIALGHYPMVWVAAPRAGKGNRLLSIADFADLPILTHARGTLPFDQISDHLKAQKRTEIRLVPSTNMAACLQMTIDGLGIACLPEAMVQRELKDATLERLNYPWVPDPLRFHARFHTETSASFVENAAQIAAKVSAQ